MVALNLIGGSRRLTEELLHAGSCDSSYAVSNKARFRVNIFSQRGNYSIVLRKLNTKVPTLEELNMPDIFHRWPRKRPAWFWSPAPPVPARRPRLAAC
jgi:Tfp pilus assembly protein, pilus retraction ATPase PilT